MRPRTFFETRGEFVGGEGATVERHLALLGVRDAYLLLVLVPLGQRHVLTTIPTGLALNDAFAKLLASLAGVERAYDAIGGLAGYQLHLLESLVRDTLAREHLHWRLHGGAPRPTTPVAIMTSAAKGNAWRVEALCEARGWWGRGRDAFRLFSQPLVPVLSAADARWLLPAPLAPLMKPGGHGVIWKLMLDEGVYDWLRGRGRAAAVLRQISNPLAGTDDTALALAGRGLARGKAFGFASCERVVGAAEGVNVLARFADEGGDGSDAAPPPRYAVTNVEYTEFGARGLVTSSAKRAAAPGSTAIHQTPVGSFYDLQLNAAELLGRCGFDVPQVGTVPEYLASGPGLIFLYHPALGPLWSVVAQKLRGGRLAPRAELQLEVAEADVQGLDLEGSLLVLADDPCDGEAEVGGACAENPDRHPRLTFSSRCGRLRLRDLAVRNAGVDYADPSNVYWRHAVARHAACRVHLHGHAELDAAGVTLVGDLDFHVPDGHRLTLRPDASPRGWSAVLEPIAAPSWNWRYALGEDGTGVVLSLEEAPARWCGSGGHA
ncbi:hypothetical protein F751_6536 [Auxenochlorella protothecoides]|uniref:UGP3-like C-terminal hexapeptide repeats domain-containing protein n=1 Tax=Auxenochlorella protothecoides TaxID=3075 RepID=A0A087STG3_AUXPR|nr:hypothetical protein F751_6536 [Auxenochlorella protothecoides]KFM29017.1 hypothetical protein F751_6536 [Auxenochlorella protothecoides]